MLYRGGSGRVKACCVLWQMISKSKNKWRRPTLVLTTIYLIHFSVSNLSVSLHLHVCQYTFATTYYQFQLSMQCTIKFGRSSYLVLHFPPLREFKDFPNVRQSKLSLCNGRKTYRKISKVTVLMKVLHFLILNNI